MGCLKNLLLLFFKILFTFILISIVSVLIFKWVHPPITPLMIKRMIEQKLNGEELKWNYQWVDLEKISPKLQLAVICSEDQKYLEHYGFDWDAIEKAFEQNQKFGKIKRGGSTISQQTAKNLFLWDGRSYIRKGLEAWFTFLIETFWSKERIMEMYLNIIEMGNGIYGAEAASLYWFKKHAYQLTKDESAAIAAILPNPRKYKANPCSPYICKRKEWIKQQMNYWGNKIDYNKYNENENEK
jgi:monofunctional biosynthetic peptidoglycan transglycosylase